MYHSFLIHSFTDGHLGCFQHLAIVNCAAMNIGVHRFLLIGVSGFLGYNPYSWLFNQCAVKFIIEPWSKVVRVKCTLISIRSKIDFITLVDSLVNIHCVKLFSVLEQRRS